MKLKFILVLFIISNMVFGQKKFQIIYQNDDYRTPIMADKSGKIIKKLDSTIYGLNYQPETVAYFSIFSIKDVKGWTAIDVNENRLFEVYNTEDGTPSPDNVIENRIRIVGKNDKIGFADKKGKILIQPSFDYVSEFHHGKAIVAENCKKVPWIEHPSESDCRHYSTVCEKYGAIDKKGKTILDTKYSYEEVAKKIKWE